MFFEWDASKEKSNLEKHGVSFAEACLIFDSPYLSVQDKRKDYGEDRFISIGQINDEPIIIIVVVHTDREGNTRIISARKASKKEREMYYEHIKKES